MSTTAVVILNYNGEKLLRQFLPSVVQHSPGAMIVVADNGSTDKSIGVINKEFPSVRVISLEKNYGFCGGYNRALKMVQADNYVLLNSDVEVTEGWLTALEEVLASHANIGAVQPKILSYRRRDHFEYAGAAGGFIDRLGYPFCRGRVFDKLETDTHQYDDVRPVFWASGACMIIRSGLYHKFGGLDEDFFAHMEEIDLCWKMQRAGYQIYYCGKSTVYHLGAGTLGYGSPAKTYLNFRNGLAMITKHFSTAELLIKLPVRIMLDWAAAVMFLIKGKPENSGAVFRAHAAYLGSIGRVLTKRREIRAQYPVYPRNTVFKGFILIESYFLGRDKLVINQ